jgi:hypothetical protein
MRIVCGGLFLWVLLSAQVVSAQTPEQLLKASRKDTLIRVAPFEDTRLGGPRLFKGGAELDLGFFAEEANRFFSTSPLALDELARVRGLRIAGLTFNITGISLMLGGLMVALVTGSLFPLMPMALLAGAMVSLGGILLNQLADTFLLRAVTLYNLEELERRQRPPERLDLPPSPPPLLPQGQFVPQGLVIPLPG